MPLTFAHPLAFCLLPPALLLLVIFRLLRARRATLDVGSLLIWQRLSALNLTPDKRKFAFDFSLLLQSLALLALIAALAFPAVTLAKGRGREMFFLIDNGPLSRARQSGVPGLNALVGNVRKRLAASSDDDRVFLARSAPFPVLLSRSSIGKNAALALLGEISPALSGPEAKSIEAYAVDRARNLNPGAPPPAVIFSLSAPPDLQAPRAPRAAGKTFWAGADSPANVKMRLDNVAIVDAGSEINERLGGAGRRILVRVANFSTAAADGNVLLEVSENGALVTLEKQTLSIPPNASLAAGFQIPARLDAPLRVSWRNASGTDDALNEDDAVMFFPRSSRAPRIRVRSELPALEKLFKSALGAEIETAESAGDAPADLDIYIQNVPEEIPASSKAALFVAPSKGYRGYFDIGPSNVVWPKVESGDADPLNADIPAGDAGISVSKAVEILQTGDFKTLLRDTASRRALALKFSDEKARPCYVLAFIPNEGLAAERLLDPPLAALLTRIAREAARSGPPYLLTKAAEIETATGRPLPLGWRPSAEDTSIVSGVLDERASNLLAAAELHGATRRADETTLDAFLKPAAEVPAIALDFLPWLALLGGALAVAKVFLRGKN